MGKRVRVHADMCGFCVCTCICVHVTVTARHQTAAQTYACSSPLGWVLAEEQLHSCETSRGLKGGSKPDISHPHSPDCS